ncbi:MAG: Gfo/Idh/MocA family oxidoreductase [Trueperaceae bacterium]|nr:MAG: Gfo/Idh/MocA family oxidoreductase [Trueperaceae bacterium]
MSDGTRLALIGCGRMAQGHVAQILRHQPTTPIPVVCEPSAQAFAEMLRIFSDAGAPPPVNEPDLARLLAAYADKLDAAFIVTPHAYHYEQASLCLEAGLDVLLEKPMVVSSAQAEALIETRDRTGGLLVVAFNGSLSPNIRYASNLLRSGELGRVESIQAVVWEGWAGDKVGHWKQDPAISGGGFMFDTGAHMLNTVADLAGEDFAEVAAWLDFRGGKVELLGVVIGRLESGALVTLHACGTTMKTIGSQVHVFCSAGIIKTGVWGRFLELQRPGDAQLTKVVPEAVGPVGGVWQQFLAVRRGDLANPSPPEIGLRMAKLWDAIKMSSERGGAQVAL